MDTEQLEEPNATVNGEPPDPALAEVDAQMAADEAAWAARDRAAGRDDQGRFTSAKEAPRAGQAEAGGDERKAEGPGDDTQSEKQQEQATPEKPGDEGKGEPKATPGEKPPAAGPEGNQKPESAWAKENARKLKTWQEINRDKEALATEREQLKLEREQLQAQSAQGAGLRDPDGYSAADYQAAAAKFKGKAATLTQQALAAEQAGDFDKADRYNAQANQEAQLAAEAGKRAEGLRPLSAASVWQRLAEDLPEVIQQGAAVNLEVRKLMRGNPALLSDPIGPFRAAVQVGRKVLQATEQKLAAAQADAGKLPGLQKQVAELSARVKELTALTSLPGHGAAMSRGGSEGKPFADLSLSEMEAVLKAEAAALGA